MKPAIIDYDPIPVRPEPDLAFSAGEDMVAPDDHLKIDKLSEWVRANASLGAAAGPTLRVSGARIVPTAPITSSPTSADFENLTYQIAKLREAINALTTGLGIKP